MISVSAIIPLETVTSVFGQHSGANQDGLFKVPIESRIDEQLTEDTFSRHLYSTFRIYTTPLTSIDLELVNVQRREITSAKHARSAKVDAFSVLFRGPQKFVLESRTYRITHDQMGTFDLFISSVNDGKKERLYEAVFNRLQQ
jgi:hypothetical protein